MSDESTEDPHDFDSSATQWPVLMVVLLLALAAVLRVITLDPPAADEKTLILMLMPLDGEDMVRQIDQFPAAVQAIADAGLRDRFDVMTWNYEQEPSEVDLERTALVIGPAFSRSAPRSVSQ